MSREVVIGTRDSALAMWQTNWVKSELESKFPDIKIKVIPIKTQGDKILDVALAKIGDKGLFTKELEVAILEGEIDLAVHSLKDLPTKLPDGLVIGAITERHDPRDVVISKNNYKLQELPEGAIVGTSSLRRQSQVRNLRPDLIIKDIRGNLNTRLRKLDNEDYDAIILAAAGVERMEWSERITEKLSTDEFYPAVGQGALGIEIKEDNEYIKDIIKELNHEPTIKAVLAERALLRTLEGGCQIPIGAIANVIDDKIKLTGFVGSIDGKELITANGEGHVGEPEKLGVEVANKLIDSGANDILCKIREEMS